MISPHTPPGTKVVKFRNGDGPINDRDKEPALPVGAILTVTKIRPSNVCASTLVAEFVETDWAISIRMLRRLDLPECLTSLLNTTPVDSGVVGQSRVPVPSLVRPPAHQLAGDAEHIADPASPASFLRLKRLLHGLRRS